MTMRVGRQAVYLGVLSVLIPLIFTLSSVMILSNDAKDRYRTMYLSYVFSMTSFPVINTLLTDLKISNSELGRLGLSSAVVADLVGNVPVVLRIFVRISHNNSDDVSAVYYEFGYLVVFGLAVAFVYRPLMLLIVRFTPEGGHVNMIFVYATLLPFLFCMNIPVLFNDFSLLLIYALGLAVPPGPPLGSALVDKFESMVLSFFLPLFVTSCAMRVNEIQFRLFDTGIQKVAMIAMVTLLVKFSACLLPLLYKRMPKNDAMALATILCSKGIVEVAAITFASDTKIINQDHFSLTMITITFLASIGPKFMRKLYDRSRKYAGYQKRIIADCKPNSELQIIACIHVPNNVNSVIKLLGVSPPTRENPIALSVLHLVKLNALANTILLSHQKGTKNVTGYCYSENVILSFKRFEATNWGAVSVNVFTAISPPNSMDDDICTLALDKLSSLIILPFHRTWYIDGSLESDDTTIRNLNCRVLEKAPCSIGILIDHGNIRRPVMRSDTLSKVSNKIAMLFMGGSDDREALALAMRMSQDARVGLTVAHFIAKSDDGEVNWQTILDSETLRGVKNNDDYINYEKHAVIDGHETVNIVRTLVVDHSLIVVGRGYNKEIPQTSGLKEWNEFPELGILGDLLASKDLGRKCSVLVVQQQQSFR
ncbi:hypothetical protein ACOSP7_020419 [Xanthoceras sorbifolium]